MQGRISQPAFLNAAMKGDLTIVQQYMAENKENPDVIPILNQGFLSAACEGHTEVVRELLSIPNIDVNYAFSLSLTEYYFLTHTDNTALMLAAAKGYIEVVRLLIGAPGINIHKVNKNGETALLLAYACNHSEIASLLLPLQQDTFDRNVFLKEIINSSSHALKQEHRANCLSTLFQMRDRSTPLGKLCLRRPDFSKRCPIKPFFEEERRFLEKINAAVSRHCPDQNKKLMQMMMVHVRRTEYDSSKYTFSSDAFDWNGALDLIKQGADPNVKIVIREQYDLHRGLVDVLQRSGLPTLEQQDELLSFGLDCKVDYALAVEKIEYILLFQRWGFDCRLRGYFYEDKRFLSIIPELLNFEVPFTDEPNVFTAIIEWLSQAKPEEITPNICAYLKSHKLKMLEIIKRYPDAEALKLLKEIFENENSALRKVFFQGHAAITKGQLKRVYEEYVSRLAKGCVGSGAKEANLDDQLKEVLNSFPFDAKAAMELVRKGANPRAAAKDGLTLIYQMIICSSNNDNDDYIKELIQHPNGFTIQYSLAGTKLPADFFINAIIKFLELGADPALFDANLMLDAYPIGKYLLAMRDPQSLLGKITRRQPLGSSFLFSRAACDADKKILARIHRSSPLFKCETLGLMLRDFSSGKFDINVALTLVREGVDPNTFYTDSLTKERIRLKDIFRQTMGTAQQFTLAQLEELLIYGLDLSIAKKPLFVATPDMYDYITLIMHYGCHPSVEMPKGSEKLTLLDCALRDANYTKPSDIAYIFDFLNYGVKITAKSDKRIMSSLLKWLAIVPAHQLSDSVVAHLKEFKDQLLNAMADLSAAQELSMLAKIFETRDEETALRKVFFAGHTNINEGRLGKAHKRYHLLKDTKPSFFANPRQVTYVDRLVDTIGAARNPEDDPREGSAVGFMNNNL